MALETWNGSVWVNVAVGTSPMCSVVGATRLAMSTASSRPRTWSMRSPGPSKRLGLEPERVLDGHEVEQAPLGLLDEVDPVVGVEQLGGPGVGFAPGRGVPAGTVERDGDMEGRGVGHACRRSHSWASNR